MNRMLKYLGKLGPSVRAANVTDWRTGAVHPIHPKIAKSLVRSGQFEDVTPEEKPAPFMVKPKAETKFTPTPEPKPETPSNG